MAGVYVADDRRYEAMPYHRVGRSGLKFPAVSLGFWHNFGSNGNFDTMRAMMRTAFDHGITQFDLANNYGPEYGSAETNAGRILAEDFRHYRDELIITSKAGYDMWPGPYGDWGSRKYLIASCDQSLKRLGLDYVDIFYHHRPDPETPIEETIGALGQIVASGKALYAGISNYNREQTEAALRAAADIHLPLIVNQRRYSIFDRGIEEDGVKRFCREQGMGIIAFSPLAQGLLTDRYLHGIPEDSRLDALVDDWNERERLAGAEASEREAAEEMRLMQGREFDHQMEIRKAAAHRKKLTIILLGLVFLVAGFGLDRFGYPMPGFGVGIPGGILLLVGLLMKTEKKETGKYLEEARAAAMEGGRAGEMREEMEKKKERIAEIDREMEEFFRDYGFGFMPEEVDDRLYEIRRAAEDYRRLSVQYDTWKDRNYGEICLRMEEDLSIFFRNYYETPEGSWQDLLQQLRADAAEYAALSARLSEARRARERVRGMQRNLGEFVLSLGLPVTGDAAGQMMEIRDRVKEIRLHEDNLEERRRRRQEFEENYDLESLRAQARTAAESSVSDLNRKREELAVREDMLDQEIAGLSRQLDGIREQLDDLGEKEALGDSIARDIDSRMHRYDLLGDTRKYLERAMQHFSVRYMDPVRNSFGRYFTMLTGQDADAFRMDSKLNVTLMEDGALRDTELLSAGYQDLVGICSRMAMVDAMYREEKPFLIMDDPFVNLDDNKQARGMEFLRRVSEDYQILYFTCHQLMAEEYKKTEEQT